MLLKRSLYGRVRLYRGSVKVPFGLRFLLLLLGLFDHCTAASLTKLLKNPSKPLWNLLEPSTNPAFGIPRRWVLAFLGMEEVVPAV